MWKLKRLVDYTHLADITNLVHFVEPTLVRRQLRHEGLMLQPFAVEVPGLIVRRVLSRQHLLIDPQSQLEDGEDKQGGSGVKNKDPNQQLRLQHRGSWRRQHLSALVQDVILYLLKTEL